MQIQTDRPINGGTVLAQGTFQGNSESGGIDGITFAPIPLTAGKSYFIDLRNIDGMGVDLGTWQSENGSPQPAGGATVNLGADYSDTATSTGFPTVSGNGDYGVSTDGMKSAWRRADPILLWLDSLVRGTVVNRSLRLCCDWPVGFSQTLVRPAEVVRLERYPQRLSRE